MSNNIDKDLLKEAKEFYDKRRADNYWFDYLASNDITENFVIGAMADFTEHNNTYISIRECLQSLGFYNKGGTTYTNDIIDVTIEGEGDLRKVIKTILDDIAYSKTKKTVTELSKVIEVEVLVQVSDYLYGKKNLGGVKLYYDFTNDKSLCDLNISRVEAEELLEESLNGEESSNDVGVYTKVTALLYDGKYHVNIDL